MIAYFISGLGADHRAFKNLILPEPFETIHLSWIPPLPDEAIASYAQRLASQIDTSKDFILVGLSFGGLIATEIARITNPHKLVLISSVAVRRELPISLRLLSAFKLEKLATHKRLFRPNKLINQAFGPLDEESTKLVHEMIAGCEPAFAQWAVKAILHWKNREKPANLLQIHGDLDKIFPARNARSAIIMRGGGHLCVYSHGAVIRSLIVHNCS